MLVANINLVALDVEWLGKDLDDAVCKCARGLALVGLTCSE